MTQNLSKYPKTVRAKRKDNGEFITGSLLYDMDMGHWAIVEYFFDIEEPKLSNQFGISAHEICFETIEVVEQ